MKYFDRFKANVSHLTSKEGLYLTDGEKKKKKNYDTVETDPYRDCSDD